MLISENVEFSTQLPYWVYGLCLYLIKHNISSDAEDFSFFIIILIVPYINIATQTAGKCTQKCQFFKNPNPKTDLAHFAHQLPLFKLLQRSIFSGRRSLLSTSLCTVQNIPIISGISKSHKGKMVSNKSLGDWKAFLWCVLIFHLIKVTGVIITC